MATIEVNGCTLWVKTSGAGVPVIHLHGSALGHENFATVTPSLARHFRVIDFDMRGYGMSERPIQHYDMKVWADDAIGLLDELGIDRAHVHGVSMGGAIAIQLAATYPERVHRIVVNGTYAKNDYAGKLAQNTRIAIALHMGIDSRVLAEFIYSTGMAREALDRDDAPLLIDSIQERFERNNRREVFVRACAALRDLDIRHFLPRIAAPTLVIGGQHDLIAPWQMGPKGAGMQYICDHVEHARRYVVKGAGHAVVSEKPEEYCRIVTAFLSGEELGDVRD